MSAPARRAPALAEEHGGGEEPSSSAEGSLREGMRALRVAGAGGPPRAAIIGAGSVGLYVGARLAASGNADVCFLMRSDYDAATARGVRLSSAEGDVTLSRPWAVRSASEIGAVDWVICALKSTAVCEATLREIVAPCVGEGTRIQVLMNGLGLEEQFARLFGGERVFGGLVFGGLTRTAPASVRHEGVPVEIRGGHFLDSPSELREAMRLWGGVHGVRYTPQPCLLRAQWQKLCWNFTFNGLTVLAGGCGVDRIVLEGPMLESATRLIRELVAVANADLRAHGKLDAASMSADETVRALIPLTRSMKTYKPSTAVDFIKRNKMEVDSIFLEPMRRAKQLGVEAPVLMLVAGLLGTIQPN